MDTQVKSAGTRIIMILAAGIVVVAGMRAAAPILIPFLLAIFIAVVCAPPVFWLQRRRVPAALAVGMVVIAILTVELVVVALLGTSVDDFLQALPHYQERLQEETAGLYALFHYFGIDPPDRSMLRQVDPGAAMRLVGNMLTSLGALLANTFLILLTVVFMLLEAAGLPGKLQAAFGSGEKIFSSLHKVADSLKRYLAIKTVISLLTGAAAALLVLSLGIDYPLLWGVLTFLLNYVPNIGSIIAAVPPILLGFIQFGIARALLAGLGYLAINTIFGNIVEPRYMGRGLGLSTLVVFVSLIFWGWVFGPVGMLLSVPLTMSMKIALETSKETRWAAVLLEDDPVAAHSANTVDDDRHELRENG